MLKIWYNDGYQRGLASMVSTFFDKTSSSVNTSGGAVKSWIILSQESAKEWQNFKFKKTKSTLSFYS